MAAGEALLAQRALVTDSVCLVDLLQRGSRYGRACVWEILDVLSLLPLVGRELRHDPLRIALLSSQGLLAEAVGLRQVLRLPAPLFASMGAIATHASRSD